MRGFVTLATGDEKYYKMARNMLHSFRVHNKDVKMAILCDRENKYTSEFDDVIVLNEANCDYRDKLRLLVDCPYDENIFIESDCLIYRNIDCFWKMLSKEYDFTSFGWPDGNFYIWFSDSIKEKYDINAIHIFNPGYMFIRNGDVCKKIYDDATEICEYLIAHKDEHPKSFIHEKLRDDPALALAMQLNGLKPAERPKVGKCMVLPGKKKVYANMIKGVLNVDDFTECNLLHFSVNKTRYGLYIQQAIVASLLCKGRKTLANIVQSKLLYGVISCPIYVKNKIHDKIHSR